MQTYAYGIIGLITMTWCSGALAAEGKDSIISKSKRDQSQGTSSDTSDGNENAFSDDQDAMLREVRPVHEDTRLWEVEIDVEGHRLIRQNDLEGAAMDKNLLYYSFSARYQLSPVDQLQAFFGVYERFLADPGETGLRSDDVMLGYSHLFYLPGGFRLSGSLRATIPTSFSSEKSSLITVPSLGFRLSRNFGSLSASVRTRGTYYWTRYSSQEGGATNPQWGVSVSADTEYSLPIWPALSLGAEVYTGYRWGYAVGTLPVGQFSGALAPPAQPAAQSYGGDVFVRWRLPELEGLKPELELALADGDPTLGYDSRLHDGAAHLYLGFRENAEAFAIFSLAY